MQAIMARSWDEDEALPLSLFVRVLLCILLPWTASLLWWLVCPGYWEARRAFPKKTRAGERIRHCQTAAMASRRGAREAALRSRCKSWSVCSALRTLLLPVLWAWLYSIGLQLRAAWAKNALYEGFDPYRILRVETTTSRGDINRAFRREALRYHPDKTQDPSAVEKFLLAKKALDALTEPEAMENFKTYGNPDGPQYVALFGIKSFIVDKEASRVDGVKRYKLRMFRVVDLQFYLMCIVLCVLLALFVGPALDVLDFDVDTERRLLSPKTLEALRGAVDSAAGIAEIQGLLLRHSSDVVPERRLSVGTEALAALRDEMESHREEGEARESGEAASKQAVLFFGHAHRLHPRLASVPERHFDSLLSHWRRMSHVLCELAAEENQRSVLLASLVLQRCIIQALDPSRLLRDPQVQLLQVPHLDEEEVRLPKPPRWNGLQDFLRLTATERKRYLGGFRLSEQSLLDVEEFVAVAPTLEIVSHSFVGEEGALRKDAMARLKIRLRRGGLEEGEAAGDAHAPLFPDVVAVTWWLCLDFPAMPRAAGTYKRCTARGRELAEELVFEVPAAGEVKCRLLIACEAYAGLDLERQLVFTARKAAQ